jgi:hypothetical protein
MFENLERSKTSWEESLMSMSMIRRLNGINDGRFRAFLDSLGREPRIAWYPSAGEDFRALLYLCPGYTSQYPAGGHEPSPPDLFLFTDYFPWSQSTFLDTRELHVDGRTRVSVRHFESLPRQDLPLDLEIIDFPQGSPATGQAVFLELDVESDVLGKMTWPLIYVFCENEPFCARRILADGGKISHVVHVRYGGGCGGGGKAHGAWLMNVLRRLECEVFLTDESQTDGPGDKAAVRLYPELGRVGDAPVLEPMRSIRSEGWSGHGDVTWNRVR